MNFLGGRTNPLDRTRVRTKKGGQFGFKRTDQRREAKEDDAGALSTSPRGRMTERHSERKRITQCHSVPF
jgi:hypothetical protein